VACISIDPGPKYITTDAYKILIGFIPINGLFEFFGSLHKTQNKNKPTIIKPRLLNVLTGSLNMPPETLSHHLDASPIR
jgi:peptidoglycan biosynthesis protein MviN/MurJ (putative lipid II flippase)